MLIRYKVAARKEIIMRKIPCLWLCLLFFWIPLNGFSGPLDIFEDHLEWQFGEEINVNLRGELTYTARWRMEEPNGALVDESSGNANFDQYDFTNNKISTRLELETSALNYTFFAGGEVFYDWVFTDKDLFNEETRDHAESDMEILDLYVEGSFSKVVFRLGRQIVQWGESIVPVNAVAVNTVSPFHGIKATSAGYSKRDYQVQSLMAWISYEPIMTMSIEGVYNPDFDPRYMLPVAGTFGSPADIMGFGAEDSYGGMIRIIDNRPEDFDDKQQYGFAVRKSFPSLKDLELGVYYYHHLNRRPVMSFSGLEVGLTDPSLVTLTYDYPEQDMYGCSFSSVIDWFDLGVQIGGELALRPNAPMQLNYFLDAFEATLLSAAGQPTRTGDSLPMGGYEETQVLYWDLSFIHALDYNMPFFGWVMTTSPILEFYGLINTEYEEHKFADPDEMNYMMMMLDFTTYEMLDNWETSLLMTYMDTLYEEKYTEAQFRLGINLKYGDNLSLIAEYTWKMGDIDQFVRANTSDRDDFTFQVTYYF